MAGFADALAQLAAIDAWADEHLGVHAPDLSPLTRLLRHVAREERGSIGYPQAAADNPRMGDEAEVALPDEQMPACELPSPETDAIRHAPAMGGPPTAKRADDRSTALERIREARQWFERHEPSSPIPVLLKRAEHLVGKRYAEIVHAIPVELLVQWGSDES
jgi:type VI secretion system protein ImpA